MGRAAILGEADLLSVHPDVIGGIDALEAKEHGPTLPLLGHGKRSAVGRDGVVVLVHVRRRSGVGIDDVAVDGDTKPPHLHAARDLDVVPFRVVESQAKEVPWPQVGRTTPVVFPNSVKRLHIRCFRQFARKSRVNRSERKGIGAGWLNVHVVDELVRPFGSIILRPFCPNGGDRSIAGVCPLRTVVHAKVFPFETSVRSRHRPEVRVDKMP